LWTDESNIYNETEKLTIVQLFGEIFRKLQTF